MPDEQTFETRCVHAGEAVGEPNAPVSPPLVLSSVFETPTLDMAARAIRGERDTYIYSRDANPTAVALERAMASLEGAEAAVATASGMAAISTLLLALLDAGDHIVMARELYGATTVLVSQHLSRFGITATAVDASSVDALEAALQSNTKLVFVETISNPLMRIADVPSIAAMTRRRGVLLVVDATFTSPALSRPLAQGADLVMHSATKYLSGHSDVTAGVVAGSDVLITKVRASRKFFGQTCSPLDAWLTLRGLKTLALRVERHTANARRLAELLEGHGRVRRVCYAGLPSSPQHHLGACELPRGCGGMLSFEIDGGKDAVDRFIAALTMVRFVASFGDVSTTISHPAVTSHGGLSAGERDALGISDGLIRVSAGIESIEDIWADFQRGLDAI